MQGFYQILQSNLFGKFEKHLRSLYLQQLRAVIDILMNNAGKMLRTTKKAKFKK